jgi:hypothetical protein
VELGSRSLFRIGWVCIRCFLSSGRLSLGFLEVPSKSPPAAELGDVACGARGRRLNQEPFDTLAVLQLDGANRQRRCHGCNQSSESFERQVIHLDLNAATSVRAVLKTRTRWFGLHHGQEAVFSRSDSGSTASGNRRDVNLAVNTDCYRHGRHRQRRECLLADNPAEMPGAIDPETGLLAVFPNAGPGPYAGSCLERSTLTGDWFGVRSTIRDDYGIIFDISSTQFYQGVASGGLRQAFPYGGRNDYFAYVDAAKLGMWQGLSVSLHGETRYGDVRDRVRLFTEQPANSQLLRL